MGSKFEMVRLYYCMKCAHIHMPPFSPIPMYPTPSKLLCFEITFFGWSF